MRRPVAGLVQSFVPLASPTKFATPTGALAGNNVQVIFPAVVSIMATGGPDVVAAFLTPGFGDDCGFSATSAIASSRNGTMKRNIELLCMFTPKYEKKNCTTSCLSLCAVIVADY